MCVGGFDSLILAIPKVKSVGELFNDATERVLLTITNRLQQRQHQTLVIRNLHEENLQFSAPGLFRQDLQRIDAAFIPSPDTSLARATVAAGPAARWPSVYTATPDRLQSWLPLVRILDED